MDIKVTWNDETMICTARVSGKHGTYTGTVKCAESDTWMYSKFAGCNYAEVKAGIKYEVARSKYLHGKYIGARHIGGEDHPEVIRFKQEYEACIATIKFLREHLIKLDKEREEYLTKKRNKEK